MSRPAPSAAFGDSSPARGGARPFFILPRAAGEGDHEVVEGADRAPAPAGLGADLPL